MDLKNNKIVNEILEIFGKKKDDGLTDEERNKLSVRNWLPIKNIVDGIVVLKNGSYVKIIEVIPVNFKLKSRADKRFLILNYRAFLKACRFPMQISVQCKKADVDPHIKRINSLIKTEKNDNVKKMIRGYIKLVSSLSHGTKSAISRRFFLIFPYTPPMSKQFTFDDVKKQLTERHAMIKEFLSKCGNEIVDANDTEWVANVLYTFFNRKTSDVQKFGGKLLNLKGLFFNSELEEGDDEENDN